MKEQKWLVFEPILDKKECLCIDNLVEEIKPVVAEKLEFEHTGLPTMGTLACLNS